MSGLSEADIKGLESASWHGGRNAWIAEIEAIVARAVNAALTEAADALDEIARTPRMWMAYPDAARLVRSRTT